MAFTLALPLFGLDLENFSALSMKLLRENLSPTGRTSPSSESDSSGVSSLTGSSESTTSELLPVLLRPETLTEIASDSQERIKEKEEENEQKKEAEKSTSIMHGNRDILELGSNIRRPFWQGKYPEKYPGSNPYDGGSISKKSNRRNQRTKTCKNCGFKSPSLKQDHPNCNETINNYNKRLNKWQPVGTVEKNALISGDAVASPANKEEIDSLKQI